MGVGTHAPMLSHHNKIQTSSTSRRGGDGRADRRAAKKLPNPRMAAQLGGSRPILRVQRQALHDKVEEEVIGGGDRLFDHSTFRDAQNALLFVLDQERRVVCVEIVFSLLGIAPVDHGLGEDSTELHYVLELLLLAVAREQRLAGIKFGKDAA